MKHYRALTGTYEEKSYIKRFIEANSNHIIELYKDFNCPLIEYSFELKGINCKFENSYFKLWLKKSCFLTKEKQKEFYYGVRFQQIDNGIVEGIGIKEFLKGEAYVGVVDSEIFGIDNIKCGENNPKKFYELMNKALEEKLSKGETNETLYR